MWLKCGKSAAIVGLLCLATVGFAEPPSGGNYGVPAQSYTVGGGNGGYGGSGPSGYQGGSGGGPSGYSSGGGHGGGYQQESYPPKPYNFGYAVNDKYSGANFGQQETSDGNNVKGQYMVLLPDGRTQIVRYNADWKNGFNAEVTYQGEAKYPEPPKGGYGGGNGGYSGNGGYNGNAGGNGGYGAPSAPQSYAPPSAPSSSYGAPSGGGYSG